MISMPRIPDSLAPKLWRSAYKWSLAEAVRPGYGERRVTRERARIPLLADLPGMVASADEYERAMAESNVEWGRQMRRERAQRWRRLRHWLEQASNTDRALFYRAWRFTPHDPEYGLDITVHIERYRGRAEGVCRGQFERYEWESEEMMGKKDE